MRALSFPFSSSLLSLPLPFAVVAIAACSTAPTPASNGLDAAAPQAVGATCNPSSAAPCLPSGDRCVGVSCDPVLHVCTQFDTDAGPPCGADIAPCTTSADCDLGLTCGFLASGGCSAKGQCINPPIACETDAASCGSEAPACGCNGLPDPFVIPGYATAPVASTTACPDGGTVFDSGSPDRSDASGTADATTD
jgi:hypothetical protein